MSLDLTQARDEICGVVKDAVNGSHDFAGLTMLWDDTQGPPPGSIKIAWLRTTVKHTDGNAATLGSTNKKKRYKNNGVVSIQIFTPVGAGQTSSDQIAALIADAYRNGSTPGGVWFRRVRALEGGVNGGWNQVTVNADFEWDEIR